MNKFVPMLAAALTAGMLCFAQNTPTPAPNANVQAAPKHHRAMDPQRQLQHMTKKLQLSADQQNQLLPILQERSSQIQSIRSDANLSRADRREKMKALQADSNAKIEALLNDQQKQTYEQMRQKAREHHQNRSDKSDG